MSRPSVQERFESFVMPVPEAGCWLWAGTQMPAGYGHFSAGGKRFLAHRYAYEQSAGAVIPPGLFVCHKCDTPCCVNPDHLFLGTHADNVRDKVAKGRHNCTKKTHCPHGHEYTPENTYTWHGRLRACRTCRAIWKRGETERRVAAREAAK